MEMFTESLMQMNLTGNNQQEILESLAKLAFSAGRVEDAEQLVQDYLAREQESTTGFGNGVAIPHAKSANVKTATILFGRSTQKIEWQSLDDQPVSTWISLLVPADAGDVHLKLLAKLSRQLVHADFVKTLKTGSQAEVFAAIENAIQK